MVRGIREGPNAQERFEMEIASILYQSLTARRLKMNAPNPRNKANENRLKKNEKYYGEYNLRASQKDASDPPGMVHRLVCQESRLINPIRGLHDVV